MLVPTWKPLVFTLKYGFIDLQKNFENKLSKYLRIGTLKNAKIVTTEVILKGDKRKQPEVFGLFKKIKNGTDFDPKTAF